MNWGVYISGPDNFTVLRYEYDIVYELEGVPFAVFCFTRHSLLSATRF